MAVVEQSDAELEKFRDEWRKEVLSRKEIALQSGGASTSGTGTAKVEKGKAVERPASTALRIGKDEDDELVKKSPEKKALSKSPTRAKGHPHPPALQSATPSSSNSNQDNKALDFYTKGADLEQAGKLSEALEYYRKAYRLDPQIQKAYDSHTLHLESSAATILAALTVTDPTLPILTHLPPPAEGYKFSAPAHYAPDYLPSSKSSKSPLGAILSSFPPLGELTFEPEDESHLTHLQRLPEETLLHLLDFLDLTSLERFALVSRKARVLTRSAPNWRRLVEKIYRPPILPSAPLPAEGEAVDGEKEKRESAWNKERVGEMLNRHSGDWRDLWVEEGRVRFDGCYVAVCHYIRAGASEMAWVNISHMITYHRFLRFYPDGTVISLLTTDHPTDVVHTLRPSLRTKGLHFGRWSFSHPPVPTPSSPPTKPAGRPPHPTILLTDLLPPAHPSAPEAKYEFEMTLTLKSTQRGRWNKLDLGEYVSIRRDVGEGGSEGGERLVLGLGSQKPFYFSKVRSYHPGL